MDKIVIRGGRRLVGEVSVGGAKNAALPILFATLLTSEPCRLRNVPDVVDVRTTLRLLDDLGARVERDGDAVVVEARQLAGSEAPYELVKTMRASFLVLGPLLARCGQARVSLPGGCAIGGRPVNLHVSGLREMGAEIELVHGYAEARAARLRGAHIHLDFPSVGATEHLMMVAASADGATIIENAAREPEIVDLAQALQSMGAHIAGAGEATIRVEGVEHLHGMDHAVVPDRIEAGTFLIAGAMTGGDVVVRGARAEHLQMLVIQAARGGRRDRRGGRLDARARSATAARGRHQDTTLSGVSHRPAGADDGGDDYGGGLQRGHREHLREPLHARERVQPARRGHRAGGSQRRRARRARSSAARR